jgi:hypothetical protein
MNTKRQSITTLEDAVDILKGQIFTRLEGKENTLADIEVLARIVNSLALTREHLALTRQTERYEKAAAVELMPGAIISTNGASENAPFVEITPGQVTNP